MIEEQNALGVGANDAPGEGRADASSGAGDEYDLVRIVSAEWTHQVTTSRMTAGKCKEHAVVYSDGASEKSGCIRTRQSDACGTATESRSGRLRVSRGGVARLQR